MRSVPGYPQGEERSFDLPIGATSIRVVIRTPTQGERRRIYRKLRGLSGEQLQAAASNQDNLKEWMREALELCFVRVEGYHRFEGGPAIETLEDLEKYGEDGITDLIAGEILAESSLSEAEKKTSAESSGSTSSVTQASPGIAASAGETTSAGPEAAMAPPPSLTSPSERSAPL
jgi:hypothetical protein